MKCGDIEDTVPVEVHNRDILENLGAGHPRTRRRHRRIHVPVHFFVNAVILLLLSKFLSAPGAIVGFNPSAHHV